MKKDRMLIPTPTGKIIDLNRLHISDIDVKDIARALSKNPCYNGATKFFYSLAQHSVIVSGRVQKKYRLEALLHHASVSYLGGGCNINTHNRIGCYNTELIEDVTIKILRRFGLSKESYYLGLCSEVRGQDDLVRCAEIDNLIENGESVRQLVGPKGKAPHIIIKPMLPEEAEVAFIKQYDNCYS